MPNHDPDDNTQPVCIALASDWGSGTESAYRVGNHIRSKEPHYTIHLGDVYYTGTETEFRKYFLGQDDWPRGQLGTYLLNGNHEMYSSGKAFFEVALKEFNQKASFFCLQNDSWRIVALDTGYYSRMLPLLELFIKRTKLHEHNIAWLRDIVFADPNDKRPVIFLSHHQWYSAFEAEYKKPGNQLEEYLNRAVLWYWGHEHRFAAYGMFGFGKEKVRGRCIGHGGMPVEVKRKPMRAEERNLVVFDRREAQVAQGGDPIGFCGFVTLHFRGPELQIIYWDEDDTKLMEERWTSSSSGEVVGTVSYHRDTLDWRQPAEALVA